MLSVVCRLMYNGSGIAEGRALAFLKLNKVNQFTYYSSASWYFVSPAFSNTMLTAGASLKVNYTIGKQSFNSQLFTVT
jgi:hypothetical protein